MRPIERLTRPRKHNLSFGGTGGFTMPPFWAGEAKEEQLGASFEDYVGRAYKANGVVFACILARQMVFSEARFQFQRFSNGRPSELFGDPGLALLERPWPGGTTGELLSRMEQDASLAGNCFLTIVDDQHGRRIRRMRPDWVTIVTGSASDDPTALDARVVGYIYKPNGKEPTLLSPDKVAHYSPIPDPDAQWRGMSWLQPVVNEILADRAATKHKLKFFENGTVGSVAITYDANVSQEAVAKFAEMFRQMHAGTDNAYKTFHLGGGADAKTLGADLKQLDFKATQGAGETRIAAAAGVGAVIAQLSEGLQGSALNAGNFQAAKRRFADGTIRPLWRSAAAALEALVPPPPAARLWFDARDVSFLQEDQKDEAQIQSTQASTIRQLIDAGFDPDKVIAAVSGGDLRSLTGAHSGLYSVQLREAGGEELAGIDPQQVEALGALIRAGFEPDSALAALGLPAIAHTGLLPVTVQSEEQLEVPE